MKLSSIKSLNESMEVTDAYLSDAFNKALEAFKSHKNYNDTHHSKSSVSKPRTDKNRVTSCFVNEWGHWRDNFRDGHSGNSYPASITEKEANAILTKLNSEFNGHGVYCVFEFGDDRTAWLKVGPSEFVKPSKDRPDAEFI